MAIYDCECGMMISTSSVSPQCMRCRRVLGDKNRVDQQESPPAAVVEVIVTERSVQCCQITLPYRLNERHVIVARAVQ